MRLKLLLAATLFTPALALAQTSGTMSSGSMAPGDASSTPSGGMMSSSSAKLSMVDTHFIKMAAVSGMAEVNDGKLASQMGSTDTIKNIGMQMVTDHTKANDQLMALAQQKGAMVPSSVDPMHAEMSAKLQKLSGSAFDKQYLHTELLGHEKTIALFKTEASTGSDPDLKSFASTTLPILKQHLAMIEAAMH